MSKLMKFTPLRVLMAMLLIVSMILGGIQVSYALEGGSSGGSGSSSGSGSISTGSPSINNAVGYRMYLTNGNIVNMGTNKWGSINSYLQYSKSNIGNSREMAIYEMFVQKGKSTSSNSYVQEQKIYNYVGSGKYYDMIDLGGNKKSNTPSFSELFVGTSLQGKLPTLDKFSYEVGYSTQQQSLINWSNSAFSEAKGGLSTTADINKFLDNYRKIVSDHGYGNAAKKLPKDASDFKKGNWAIVVEPSGV